MGRKKGTVTKYYEKELKIKLINEALDNGINLTARKYNISQGMLCNWIKSYKTNNYIHLIYITQRNLKHCLQLFKNKL